jgi:hypothetical protein
LSCEIGRSGNTTPLPATFEAVRRLGTAQTSREAVRYIIESQLPAKPFEKPFVSALLKTVKSTKCLKSLVGAPGLEIAD